MLIGFLGSDYGHREVMNGMRYNRSADVWSFGALLSYLMTGERPFGEYEAGAQILAAIIVEKKIPEYEAGAQILAAT